MHPQYAMPYHWHEELEFIHILEGTFEVCLNDVTTTAAAGDLLIANSGCLHGGTPHACIYECLVFSAGLLVNQTFYSDFLKKLSVMDIWLNEYYPANSASSVLPLAVRLFQAARDCGPGHELITAGLLYQIMGSIETEGLYTLMEQKNLARHKNIRLLKKVLNYIENHYSERIELNTLAKIAGMSPKYFCRFFFEMTQHTPIDYVNYYRIERACYQLVNTDDSITEVALSCGFNDISYFIKTFRKYKDKSPRQYLNATLVASNH